MLLCYICGREYGTASLPIHQPQCLRRWEAEQAKLPAEKRRAEPAKPVIEDWMDETSAREQAISSYKQNALEPCPNCGRTFMPDRLLVHLKSCKPGNSAKPVGVVAVLENVEKNAAPARRWSCCWTG